MPSPPDDKSIQLKLIFKSRTWQLLSSTRWHPLALPTPPPPSTIINTANNSRDSQSGTLKGRRRGSGLRPQKWRSSTAAGDLMTFQPTEGGNLSQMFPDAQPGNRGSPGRFIPQEPTETPGEPRSQGPANAPLIGRSRGGTVSFPTGPETPTSPPLPPTPRHHTGGRCQKGKYAKIRGHHVELD